MLPSLVHVLHSTFSIGSASSSFHLAPGGSSECDYGTVVGKSECESAVRTLAKNAGKFPSSSMVVGVGRTCGGYGWGHAPLGCSAQSGGGWAAHYKTDGDSGERCMRKMYQLVCSYTGNFYTSYTCFLLVYILFYFLCVFDRKYSF